MTGFAARFKSFIIRSLALALPFLVGCEGSQQVDIDLPDAVVAGLPFEVTVTNAFDPDFSPFSSTNASMVFAAIVPETWSATSAQYDGTANGSPYMVPVSISGAPPEGSEDLLELFLALISDEVPGEFGGLTCDATVSLREGPLHDDPLIATLFNSVAASDLASRDAGPVSLAPYAGGSVYLVSDVSSCVAPNGLIVDNLVVDTGSGNLLSNASFESGFTDWDTSGSDSECVNEVLGEDDITGGGGAWVIPLPTDGVLLYASDAINPSRCLLSQEISVPDGADATAFTGDIGVTVFAFDFLFLGQAEIPLEEGQKIIWFRTGDIALFDDIGDGDSGQLSANFIASDDTEEETEIIFLHGYYSEVPEEEFEVTAGVGLWFIDLGPSPFPQSIQASLQVLASTVGAPIPVMSGYMLMGLSVVIAFVGVRRRRTGGKRK